MLDLFRQLYEEVKIFKANRIKDNKEKRENLDLVAKRRSQTQEFLIKLNALLSEFENVKSRFKLDVISDIQTYVSATETLITDIQTVLAQRLDKGITMAESFDLRTAATLIPSMNGSEDTTKQLIDSIKLYAEMLKPEHQVFLINYVLKTRLSEEAKVRLAKNYNSVDMLVEDIQSNFITKKSATVLSSQLHHSQQLHKSVDEYGKEIEKLLSELTLAQAGSDENLLKLLRPVNETLAINSFCNGLKNNELRTILKARNCTTIKEAISIAKDEESTRVVKNVVYFNKTSSNNYHAFRGNSRPKYNKSSNFNSRSNSNNYNNNSNNFSNARRFSNTSGNQRKRGNFRTDRGKHSHTSNRSNVFYAEPKEVPQNTDQFFRA